MMHALTLLTDCPVPIAEVPPELRLKIIGAAGAGFPSPAQDWQETAIDLVELLRLDRAASFVFRVSGSSMIDAGLYDKDERAYDTKRQLKSPAWTTRIAEIPVAR